MTKAITYEGWDRGAEFSECRRYRYALWRIWDTSKAPVMFIGLNPSTADESEDDNTIKSVIRIAQSNGYGGVYMMNAFPFISTNPDDLKNFANTAKNDHMLYEVAKKCDNIIFAWGDFDIVKILGRDVELIGMFPEALALKQNKSGSPAHPLYIKSDTVPKKFFSRYDAGK